jgi:dihydrofolate reductase
VASLHELASTIEKEARMAEIVAFISLTLDGVMQAPGTPDEDTRGGFEFGGWAAPYADEDSGRMAAQGMANTDALLLGRRTYENLLESWNERGGPFKDMLNNTPKHVASRTLKEPLPWPNSSLLGADASEAVAGLREKPGKDIVVLGSGDLLRTLMRHRLVDRFVLLIHPIVLGKGRRLFDQGGPDVSFHLTDSQTTSTGVVMATYAVAGEVPRS